ncbi:hypothetical protein GGR51DRAFT_555216 [Nemania sp. FL0031]|nr:hypothetical protein GGR51DRAFT_555216 [Nemania sp. FL0031]
MANIGDSPKAQDSPDGASPLGSPIVLNPRAVEFASGQPERQRSPPQGPANGRYPTIPSSYGRGARGRGKGQIPSGLLPHSHILSRPGRQGANPHFPVLYPFGSGQGFQPMFHTGQFPSPAPGYVSFPVMTYPPPPPGFQHPQPLFTDPRSGSNAPEPVKEPTAQSLNRTPPKGPTSRPSTRRQSISSTQGHPRPSVSSSPQGGSETPKTPGRKTRQDWLEEYQQEFETARSFEDDHIYFPKGSPRKGPPKGRK